MMLSWLNPLSGNGYQFWSGIGSDVFLLAPIGMLAHHLNCHEPGCWRLVRHRHTHCAKHTPPA